MADIEIKLASLSEILKNIEEKVGTLERNDKEILNKIDELKGGKIADLDTQVVRLQEQVSVLQKFIYGLVGAVLLSVVGAVLSLILK
jgi:chromosome segregation ATPase